jgi:hypothetical protein
VLIAVGLISCSSQASRDDQLQQEIDTLERKIVPLDGKVIAHSGLVRNDMRVTASWDIETTTSEADYSKWLVTRLEPEFKSLKSEESRLTFFKHVDSDILSVECKLAEEKHKLHAHVVFTASPN